MVRLRLPVYGGGSGGERCAMVDAVSHACVGVDMVVVHDGWGPLDVDNGGGGKFVVAVRALAPPARNVQGSVLRSVSKVKQARRWCRCAAVGECHGLADPVRVRGGGYFICAVEFGGGGVSDPRFAQVLAR